MATIKQLQTTLKLTYGLVPMVAGFDKFTNVLVNWTDYLGSNIKTMLPVDPSTLMKGVGIIEIVAGIIVLLRPLLGAYIVMAWLCCIAITLVVGGHYDIAVRDLVMAIGAFTLAQLTMINTQNNK